MIALSVGSVCGCPTGHQFTRSNLFLAIYYLVFMGLLKFEIPVSPDSHGGLASGGYDNVERDLFLRSWHHEAGNATKRHFTKIGVGGEVLDHFLQPSVPASAIRGDIIWNEWGAYQRKRDF